MAKPETTLERVYNVPLRKEYLKAPNWRRTKKAVTALREFLVHHMKSEDIKISPEINEKLWQSGIRNPPHHIKVTVTKNEKGLVKAELFGSKKEEKKEVAPKKQVKKATVKPVAKTTSKVEKQE